MYAAHYARHAVSVLDEAAPAENDEKIVHVNAEAGCNWDDFVDYCVGLGLEGVEGLSGIPGTVGASVVQNIGAYGQEVASSVESVEVWDRKDKQTKELTNQELHFGYRMSALKASMYSAPATPIPSGTFFFGLTVSSEVVATTSKPRNAKNTSAAPEMMPAMP